MYGNIPERAPLTPKAIEQEFDHGSVGRYDPQRRANGRRKAHPSGSLQPIAALCTGRAKAGEGPAPMASIHYARRRAYRDSECGLVPCKGSNPDRQLSGPSKPREADKARAGATCR